MLSDEDKADIIANKANYSLNEIKAKLAVICYDKKVNFNLETSDNSESNKEQDNKEEILTFNFNN